MKILVTGGAGFIGLGTARALAARGDEVRILDALTQPVHEPGAAGPGEFELLRGDVRSKDDWIKALDGVDAVMHMAAYQDYRTDFSTFFHVNAAGTALLYEVIVERSLPVQRVVVASSQAVYGEGAYRCPRDGIVACEPRPRERLEAGDFEQRCPRCGGAVEPVPTPEEMGDPRNAYGISKLAQERAALALGETYGIPTAALRYSIVHGPGQSPRNAYSGLLRSACLNLLAGAPPVAFEDGLQRRDYVAIEDVVAANLLALDHFDAPGRAYNVGGDRAWTVLEVLDALRGLTGVEVGPAVPGTYRVGDTRHIVSDIARLRTLGWEPQADLTEVWRRYWEWLGSLGVDPGIAVRAYEDMLARGVLRSST
ncbi:MAG: NAD-dependent epimerase/dehydratase family protein [Actinomycetota bacterium]